MAYLPVWRTAIVPKAYVWLRAAVNWHRDLDLKATDKCNRAKNNPIIIIMRQQLTFTSVGKLLIAHADYICNKNSGRKHLPIQETHPHAMFSIYYHSLTFSKSQTRANSMERYIQTDSTYQYYLCLHKIETVQNYQTVHNSTTWSRQKTNSRQ